MGSTVLVIFIWIGQKAVTARNVFPTEMKWNESKNNHKETSRTHKNIMKTNEVFEMKTNQPPPTHTKKKTEKKTLHSTTKYKHCYFTVYTVCYQSPRDRSQTQESQLAVRAPRLLRQIQNYCFFLHTICHPADELPVQSLFHIHWSKISILFQIPYSNQMTIPGGKYSNRLSIIFR